MVSYDLILFMLKIKNEEIYMRTLFKNYTCMHITAINALQKIKAQIPLILHEE